MNRGNLQRAIGCVFLMFSALLVGCSKPIDGRYKPIEGGSVIRDLETGLEWQRCSVGQAWNESEKRCDGEASAMRWSEATAQTAPGGFRLPTKEELRTIVYCSNTGRYDSNGDNSECGSDYQRPTINMEAFPREAFPGTPGDGLWSSSPHVSSTLLLGAWNVLFYYGGVYPTGQTALNGVRLVRAGD